MCSLLIIVLKAVLPLVCTVSPIVGMCPVMYGPPSAQPLISPSPESIGHWPGVEEDHFSPLTGPLCPLIYIPPLPPSWWVWFTVSQARHTATHWKCAPQAIAEPLTRHEKRCRCSDCACGKFLWNCGTVEFFHEFW